MTEGSRRRPKSLGRYGVRAGYRAWGRTNVRPLAKVSLERATGIEPAYAPRGPASRPGQILRRGVHQFDKSQVSRTRAAPSLVTTPGSIMPPIAAYAWGSGLRGTVDDVKMVVQQYNCDITHCLDGWARLIDR